MRMMIPFTPHIAYECLEKLNFKENISWPKIEKKKGLNEVKMQYKLMEKLKQLLIKDMDQVIKKTYNR